MGLASLVFDSGFGWLDGKLGMYRVRTDLEKSLNLTLVLENSWNLKTVQFVLELSWNFVKLPLKM